MAKENVEKFFAQVHGDESLQGALHGALVETSPNIVVAIAKAKGFDFSSRELAEVVIAGAAPKDPQRLGKAQMESAAGGGLAGMTFLKQNFWSSFKSINVNALDGIASSFVKTSGPSFAQVMGDHEAEGPDVEQVSAVDLYAAMK